MAMHPDRRTVLVGLTVLVLIVGVTAAIVLSGGGDDATAPPPSSPTCPLTGTRPDSSAVLQRPALVVKIDNVEPRARPQVGIRQADLVYEEMVEGSITRFMAVFHCTDAAPIGPVRSARSTDIALFSQFNRPLFAWSGANEAFARMVQDSNIVDVGHTPAEDQYYRERARPAPHNLFIHGYTRMLAAHAPADAKPPPAMFTYRKTNADPGGQPSQGVHIVFGTGAGSAPVDWNWSGTVWVRAQAGRPHLDDSGAAVDAQNVIVQFVNYRSVRGLPEAALVGEGDAWILTGGRLIQGRWRKPSVDAVIEYATRPGRRINLTPGRTWVALAPPGGATMIPDRG
jgi:hypothetical protein